MSRTRPVHFRPSSLATRTPCETRIVNKILTTPDPAAVTCPKCQRIAKETPCAP